MQVLRLLITGLVLIVLAACSASQGKERGKIYCPACGTEFDTLFEKRF